MKIPDTRVPKPSAAPMGWDRGEERGGAGEGGGGVI